MSNDDLSVERGELGYPSSVRQILMKRSAPQPAIMKTPTGGTTLKVSKFRVTGWKGQILRMVMMMMRRAEIGLMSAITFYFLAGGIRKVCIREW